MKAFRYEIISGSGERLRGEINAADEDEARSRVLQMDGTLTRLQAKSDWFSFERERSFTPADFHLFLIGLAPMLRAGGTLRTALAILAKSDRSQSAVLARNVLALVDEGRLFSEALADQGDTGLIVSEFVRAGEAGGGLERMCTLAAEFLAARMAVFKEIRSSLAYPVFVIGLAIVAILILMVFVAPALAPVLPETGEAQLVKLFAAAGAFIAAHSTWLLLGIAGLVALLAIAARQWDVIAQMGRFAIRLPILKTLWRDLSMGPASRAISALLSAGLPLTSSLRSVSKTVSSPFQDALRELAERLDDGVPLQLALQSNGRYFPPEFERLVLLSEASDNLALGFDQAGVLCQERALARVKQLSAVLGPALVVGVGGIVAAIMLLLLSSLTAIGDGAL